MDAPAPKAQETTFAEVDSVEDESPTASARLCIERGRVEVTAKVPRGHTTDLLRAAVIALISICAVAAPMLTLKLLPSGAADWETVSVIGLQFCILGLMGACAFKIKPPHRHRRDG